MPGEPWSKKEIDLIIADYFEMLGLELKKQPFVKAERNAALRQFIQRNRSAVEKKHQNISAVLNQLGMPWIRGYKPAKNYQKALLEGILHHIQKTQLVLNPIDTWLQNLPADLTLAYDDAPPQARYQDAGWESPKFRQPAHTAHHAMSDESRRNVGTWGEQLVLESERAILFNAGRKDLAKKVRWVSQEDGDGAGYDIRSYSRSGEQRLLEVKATLSRCKTTHFFLTENEWRVSEERQDIYRLVRVYDAAGLQPKAFKLVPPLENSVRLQAIQYRALLL